jgi:ubiquinone/menaquinone biosynthesis C-methylase UbiE
VLALDVQAGMLERAKTRIANAELDNVDFLQAGLGEGKLTGNTFDRALLVTVLGEIPDKLSALIEIHNALKPGGFLSVTEVLPDPDYQSAASVKALAEQAGFKVKERYGSFFIFTMNLEKAK